MPLFPSRVAKSPWISIDLTNSTKPASAGSTAFVRNSRATPPPPLKLAVACDLDDLSYREFPRKPREEAGRINAIAADIVSALSRGEGCLVHCAAGRGRTGSVIGVALWRLGVPADVPPD